MWDSILSLISSLIIIIAVLFAAYAFTKFLAGRLYAGQNTYRTRRMKVLEQITTGKDQKLMLVQMGEQLYFLGVTSGSITCIERVSKEQASEWNDEDKQKQAQQSEMNFSDTLRKVAQQFNSKGRP